MSPTRLLASAAALLALACGPAATAPVASSSGLGQLPPPGDAPYELADDQDLDEQRAQLDAMADDHPERVALRQRLAAEYARRIDRAVKEPYTRFRAHETLLALLAMWSPEELAGAAGNPRALRAQLAPYAAAVEKSRAIFARSGGDEETTAALFFLTLAEPDRKADYLAEVDDIFAFGNALAVAQYGSGAERARPIAILEAVVEAAAIPEAVDRLLSLYVARQAAFDAHFRLHGASTELFEAHGEGVFSTAWHIIRVLARANRLDDAPALLEPLSGIGADTTLRKRLDRALGSEAAPRDWLTLAEAFSGEVKAKEPEKRQKSKLRAALAVAREGARRFSRDANLLIVAGTAARKLEQVPLAIALYEQALQRDRDRRDAAEELADLYRLRVSALAFQERPLAARKQLRSLETFHANINQRWPNKPLESDLAEAYASMGRGMIGLGELSEAKTYLGKSLDQRATSGALELLGTVELKRDRFTAAIEHFDRAADLPANSPLDLYNLAKILRLAGDARAAAGQSQEAEESYSASLGAWMKLDRQIDLPTEFKGEMLVELGKGQWAMGDRDLAMTAFERAVDIDRDGADTHSSVVAFLIVRGEYDGALDAYHRALGSYEIGEYSKVYMSLWVLAEAKRSGKRPDPLAMEYLASRQGKLWYHQLARFATGRTDRPALEPKATTRGRRAELLYYDAVLGAATQPADIRKLLRQVLATDMVLFYEYDMAKYWLTEGFTPQQQASR